MSNLPMFKPTHDITKAERDTRKKEVRWLYLNWPYTQTQLANMFGWSQKQISNICRGGNCGADAQALPWVGKYYTTGATYG